MRPTAIGLSLCLLLTLPLTACGRGGDDDAGGDRGITPSDSPSASASASAAGRPSGTAKISPSELALPTTPVKKQRELKLTGRLVEGVEAGCEVLRTDDGRTVTLAGDLTRLRGVTGDRVVVRGRIDLDRVSTCQQGPVFVVSEIIRSE